MPLSGAVHAKLQRLDGLLQSNDAASREPHAMLTSLLAELKRTQPAKLRCHLLAGWPQLVSHLSAPHLVTLCALEPSLVDLGVSQNALREAMILQQPQRFLALLQVGVVPSLALLQASLTLESPVYKRALLNRKQFPQCIYSEREFYLTVASQAYVDKDVHAYRRDYHSSVGRFFLPRSPKLVYKAACIGAGLGAALGLIAGCMTVGYVYLLFSQSSSALSATMMGTGNGLLLDALLLAASLAYIALSISLSALMFGVLLGLAAYAADRLSSAVVDSAQWLMGKAADGDTDTAAGPVRPLPMK